MSDDIASTTRCLLEHLGEKALQHLFRGLCNADPRLRTTDPIRYALQSCDLPPHAVEQRYAEATYAAAPVGMSPVERWWCWWHHQEHADRCAELVRFVIAEIDRRDFRRQLLAN